MNNLDKAIQAWGDMIPEWVHIFAGACDSASQKKVADQLGYSPTVINQVIGNKYPGDLSAVKTAVEGALMGYTVDCPELGEMKANVCLAHQGRKFTPTNHMRVRLYKACRSGCPHSRIRR